MDSETLSFGQLALLAVLALVTILGCPATWLLQTELQTRVVVTCAAIAVIGAARWLVTNRCPNGALRRIATLLFAVGGVGLLMRLALPASLSVTGYDASIALTVAAGDLSNNLVQALSGVLLCFFAYRLVSARGSSIGRTQAEPGVVLVRNADVARFIKDRGYNRRHLWSSEGWAARCAKGWSSPLDWEAQRHSPRAPAVGLSFYELQAVARHKGGRLASSQELKKRGRATANDGELLFWLSDSHTEEWWRGPTEDPGRKLAVSIQRDDVEVHVLPAAGRFLDVAAFICAG